MNRKMYVHIGTHKTGTTSIQAFLRSKTNALKECGIYIPNSGTINPSSGHHNIAWQLRNDRRYRKNFGNVKDLINEIEISQYQTSVISSEDFEYLSQYPDQLKNFDRLIENLGYSCEYIVFFRNKNSYLTSLYQELLKHGLSDSYDDFKNSIIKNKSFTYRDGWYFEFNYQRFINQWKSILNKKITFYSFDEIANKEGLLPFFMSIIDSSEEIINDSKKAAKLNTSLFTYPKDWLLNKYGRVKETIASFF